MFASISLASLPVLRLHVLWDATAAALDARCLQTFAMRTLATVQHLAAEALGGHSFDGA